MIILKQSFSFIQKLLFAHLNANNVLIRKKTLRIEQKLLIRSTYTSLATNEILS